jgi:L-threonylcarbamoyladenylate synthase
MRNTSEILPSHTPDLFRAAVRRAAELLRAGEVVALPTETVYGLAANALDAEAVARIYEVKGRPAHNPIIVHVADRAMAQRCVADWPGSADKLASAFWPGPLTLVLPRAKVIPEIVTAGGPTVGVRWPSHPFIQAVILECGFPLAAPSANLSNRVSPTNAGHVRAQLEGRIPLIVDGGQSQVGIESTVLDLTSEPPRVLRPGMIHLESIAAVIGHVSDLHGRRSDETVLRSPGQLEKHYAPRAKLVV